MVSISGISPKNPQDYVESIGTYIATGRPSYGFVAWETVTTEVIGMPSVVIVVVTDGDQVAMRFTPKWGCSGNARARTWAVSVIEAFPARPKADARRRVPCGAKTRKGTACLNKSEPGKRRCKFHGGKSTGARTPEGRERIAEAQRRRWAKWRENHPI